MTDEIGVGVLMFIAYRYEEGRILDAVQHAGFTDLTVAQSRIAARIGPDGTRLSDLAAQAQVAKQTATALVDRLEAAGYVERTADPSDARATLVRIAERGAAAIAVARAEEFTIEAEWAQRLGPRRMRQLREALALLRDITDPYWVPGE